MRGVIPDEQRRTLAQLDERLDLSVGDSEAKRSAFWVMLTLSAVIAVAGVVSDSTATVIGAMIVAPLSTPILGVGLGITTGRGALVGRSLMYVVGGICVVVVLGIVFAQILPNPTNVLANSQVLGRTSPTLMDLTAALATGLVGAIAVARKDVGDVLPGVAIAISLVPPLAVVGVCLGSGSPALALGAFVLFASNVVAMIITGTAVFVVAGYTRDAGISKTSHRRAYALLTALLIVVAIPMVGNSLSSLWATQIATAAEQWLDGTPGAEVTGVTWQGSTATVAVLGPETLPPLDELEKSVDALIPWNPDVQVVHTVGARIVVE
ncbi:TIGR00341 family protein [Rhodococcus sp. SRB_17]|uniref:TIGR00341 family protein n=1 Tax=Rhodococcus sp. OK302 TaxID=1882769 RepID=UPI000B945B8F|nr:TIGR00341 family protein [Rhodococcus sp. OK302]NMM82801.1 TIGR00341 family protein [Rhodococcus sp. SRB_17]OYD68240.1 putative hydrophobic protein (TIGR00341 family) [Rhodococcus sp. OK302]